MTGATGDFRLSPQQRRIWRLQQAAGGRPLCARGLVLLEGNLDSGRLRRAVAAVIDRFEILRTTFPVPAGLELPVQRVAAGGEARWPEAPEEDLDLEKGPLLHLSLTASAPDRHTLAVRLSALCGDGTSLRNLVAEIARAYGEPDGEGEEPLQYADLAEWQNELLVSEQTQAGRERWMRWDPAVLRALQLPFETPADGAGCDLRSVPLSIDPGVARRLSALAGEAGVPVDLPLLTAWQLLLGRLTGQPELVVGLHVEGRSYEGLDGALGPLARLVPLAGRWDAGTSFARLLRQTGEAVTAAEEWQEFFHWEQIAEQRGLDLERTLFPAGFGLARWPSIPEADGVRFSWLRCEADVDLCRLYLDLHLDGHLDGEQLGGALRYDAGRLAEEDAGRLARALEVLLAAAAADPEAPAGTLALLGESERRQLLGGPRDRRREPRGVPELFEEQARRVPERTAVVCEDRSLTFAELADQADRLARRLRQLGVGSDERVAICLDRSVEMVVALLATFRAGGAYLPLEPGLPRERKELLLADARPRAVVTESRFLAGLPAEGRSVLCLDHLDHELPEEPGTGTGVDPASLAYVVYTSGSTGMPKGVQIEHRHLAAYMASILPVLDLPDEATFAMISTFAADLGNTVLFPPLCAGGTLHLISPERASHPEALAGYFESHPIDCLKITPSHLEALLAGSAGGRVLPRRTLVLGGEASRREWVESLRGLAPGCTILNHYGPTETTVGVLTHRLPAGQWALPAALPLGRPLPHAAAWLLDSSFEPLPAWFPGELYLGGDSVARGYLGRPDLTAERFLPDPFSGVPGARLYRSGDLARHRPGGDFEFLGRADDQVKVRGFRVELGEIEAVLESHPRVRRAAAAVSGADAASRRLVAYVVSADGELDEDRLLAHLRERLPDFMVPAALVPLPALPLNANGKVDRRALPEPEWRRLAGRTEHVAPRTPMERRLAEVWAEVLDVETIGVEDNFFHAGGDSIRGIVLRARAEERRLVFSVQQLFENPTVAGLARLLEQTGGGTPGLSETVATEPFGLLSPADRERLPAGLDDAYPVTRLQGGMLFHSELEAGSAIFHDIHSFRVRSRFDAGLLRQALAHVSARHAVLRTSFDLSGYGEPLQLVHSGAVVPLEVTDLRGLDAAAQEETIARWLRQERRRAFDWTRPPLIVFHAHLCGEETFQITMSFHHAILDGWSSASLLTELFQLYVALLAGEPLPAEPPPPVSFRDFVALERATLASAEALDFWRGVLDEAPWTGVPRRSGTVADTAGAAESEARTVRPPIPPELSADLDRAARVLGVPLKSALLGAHLKVLSLLAGDSDVMTSLVSHGRPEVAGGERVLGLFLNGLPLRLRLPAGSWRDLAHAVFDREREMHPFRRLPLSELQRWNGGKPLFETAYNFLHYHVYRAVEGLPGVQVLGGNNYEENNFALVAQFSLDGDGLSLELLYRAPDLEDSQVEAIGGYYLRALAALAADPQGSHEAVCLLSDNEQRQVLQEWGPGAPVPLPETGFAELFLARARQAPEAAAAACGGRELTYAELAGRSERVAGALAAAGVGPEFLVALLAERGLDLLTAVLGVFAAGGAYLPLDPRHPVLRQAEVLRDSGARLVLVERRLLPALQAALDGRTRLLALEDVLEAQGPEAPRSPALPGNLAYVIYTSGSTGRPKGAMVEQRGMVNHLTAKVLDLGLTAGDVVAQTASQCFDISVWQLLVPLLAGGRVRIFPDEVAHDPLRLLDELESHGVTVVEVVPSLLAVLLEEAERRGPARPPLGRLRWMIPTGEALPPDLCRRWLRLYPGIPLLNAYGPTECSDDVAHHPIRTAPAEDEALTPIGRPVANTRLHVLGPGLQPLPAGTAGELCVGGAGVGRGYLGDGGRTAASWCPDPFVPGERLYRTGDLARFRAGGELEFLGRADHQVKVRGHRIELGEIEAVLDRHPAVGRCAVLAWPDDAGGPRLVAYVAAAGDRQESAEELRGFLAERLPESMVPWAFVTLPALPLTANGKLDRRALPPPETPEGERRETAAPRSPVEEVIAGVWADLLGLAEVGTGDDFFALGGHSLLATQAVSRLRGLFGVELPLRALFDQPTVAGLAERVEAALRAGEAGAAPPLRPAPRGVDLPLSFAQQRLWFLHQLDPESTTYNMPFSFRLDGRLDVPALERGLERIVARHETLRTTFPVRDGLPSQRIAPAGPQPLPVVDLSGLPAELREPTARGIARREEGLPFDLTRPPVVRPRLLRLDGEGHVLLFTLHHISSDGWSMGVLTRELVALYRAFTEGGEPDLPELPVQYADFALWQREWLRDEVLEAQIAYWRRHLEGAPAVLELPTDRPRPPLQTHRGARESAALPDGLAAGAARLARGNGATLYMVLLSAFKALLHRYTGQGTIVVGTPIANRNRAEIEGLIGFFANTLALRTDLGDDPGFRELLGRVRESALGGYAHQDLPFEKLVDELRPARDMGRAPLFQVMFVFQNAPTVAAQLPGLELRPFGGGVAVARFDLTLIVLERSHGLFLDLDYDADLFEPGSMARLLRLFRNLLAGAVAAPAAAVSDLPWLDAEEERQVVFGWNDTGRAVPDVRLHQLFEHQARRAPAAPAVLAGTETATYGELERRANQLARRLRRLGVGPESCVGLCLERSVNALVAMLAVLKAGGAYVPLDPEAPRGRLEAILADSGARAVLTRERLAPAVAGWPAVLLDAERAALDSESPEPLPGPSVLPENAAYVIYTSGSTGTAKGVVVTHRAVVHFVHAMAAALDLGPDDRLLLFAPLSFDASVLQIFPTLASGAALAVHPNPRELSSHEILELCAARGVTVLDLPAALWRQWVEDVAAARWPLPPGLRAFLTGGESVPAARLRTWAALAGRPVSFLSSYGPTEATVTTTVWQTTSDEAAALAAAHVPIGRPLPNARVYVLDRKLRPVPRGVAGELFLGGAGLARGYLGQPDRTAEAFVPDPLSGEPGGRLYRTGDLGRHRLDGDLEFLGRADHQAKIRGFRVEIGEIEAALSRHPDVRQAVVTVREDTPGDPRLVAYVLPRDGRQADPAGLRVLLSETLPSYMVPSAFVPLAELPVLASGKLNRAALPAPEPLSSEPSAGFVAPRDPLETVLAGIWAEVLGAGRVGVHDNFFELGGHSLTATQLITRIRKTLEIEVPLRQIFESPTVAGAAAAILDDPERRERAVKVASALVQLSGLSDEEVEAMLLAEMEIEAEAERRTL